MRDEIARDIQQHIEVETRDNIERGMPPADARAAALRKFGNPLRVAEETRAVWRWAWVERLLQDARYAVRGLRRDPLFAAVAILTLALGIGMNTAVFSVVSAALIEPLAYPHAERLVWITIYNKIFKAEVVSGSDFVDWRAQAQSFDRMAAYGYGDQTLAYGSYAEQATVAQVTGDFWPMTGVMPAIGRLFGGDERGVVVLSHALFERRFAGEAGIVGKTVLLNGRPVMVAGVLPRGFRFLFPMPERPDIDPKQIDAYAPADITPQNQLRNRPNALVNVVARIRPGVTLEQARGEMQTIEGRIVKQFSGLLNLQGTELRLMPVNEKLVGDVRPALLILLGAVAFVLLIACANIAGLLLARAAKRRREVAIRAAVGAGQRRMVAQFLAEGLVLALAGGAVGLAVARCAIVALQNFGARAVPRVEGASLDARVLVFTLAASVVSGLLFGIGPALSLARANLAGELKDGGKTPAGAWRLRLRTLLVAGELAVAMVLLTGAGLMVKSFWRMNARPAGFDPQRILTMKVSLSGAAYRDQSKQIAYFGEAVQRLTATPGVVAAGVVYSPVRGVVQWEGTPASRPGQVPGGLFYLTSPGYFRAMGIQLRAGRWMTDNEPSEVALVNEAFVRRIAHGSAVVGKRMHIPRQAPNPESLIVGVVSDVKYSKLDAEPGPEIYFPYRQSSFNRTSDLVALAAGDPAGLAATVRKAVAEIDRTQPVFNVQTLDQTLSDSIAPRRFNLILLAAFAASALALALVGIYGAISHAVAQRTHEIGVRMALGARRGELVGMVVRSAMAVAAVGIAVGVAAAIGLTRLMTALLYEVKPNDPQTLIVVATIVAATALAAAWLPARRAAQVDPMIALRHE
jgi:putative ABC transport system permease protein